jgi:tetratricopeptide (TPR) repeat protein
MPYALLAGDQATRLYAHAEATTYYTQALTIARALPASLETRQAQIDAALRLAAVGLHFERDGENLEQARLLAAGLHDEPRLAGVLYWLGRLHYARGNFQAAIEQAQQSLTIADRLGDGALAAPPVNLLGRVYYMRADYERASRMMVRSVEQMQQLGNTTEEATIAAFAGTALAYLGDFARARQYAEHGLHLAQELQNPFATAAAYHYRGMLYDQYGVWTQALADYKAARHLAVQAGDRFRTYLVQVWAGRAHAMAGNPSRGRTLLEESMTLAKQLGTTCAMPCLHTFHTTCLLALGERDGLLLRCHEAIRLAHETGDKFSEALAYRTLAEALSDLEPATLQQTEHAITEAIRLHQEIGNTPELARTYACYARLLQAHGKTDQTRAYLTQASDLFRHMGMAWDRARAEQAWRTLA